jgi:hypothetical protein
MEAAGLELASKGAWYFVGTSGAPESGCVLPGQTESFTGEHELIGQIEAALASGRFEAARLNRDALTATEAVSAGLPNLGRWMYDGGLSRLTERYTAAKSVAAAPTMRATLTNRTCMATDIDEVWSRGRVRR